jgi:hypothetical protein
LISRSFAAQPRRELVGFQIIMFADYPFSPAGLVGLPEAGGTSSGNIHCREAHQFGQDLYACHDLSILSCAPWHRSFGTSSTAFSPGVDSIDCFSQSFPRRPGKRPHVTEKPVVSRQLVQLKENSHTTKLESPTVNFVSRRTSLPSASPHYIGITPPLLKVFRSITSAVAHEIPIIRVIPHHGAYPLSAPSRPQPKDAAL